MSINLPKTELLFALFTVLQFILKEDQYSKEAFQDIAFF